jgi:hypothetical protein
MDHKAEFLNAIRAPHSRRPASLNDMLCQRELEQTRNGNGYRIPVKPPCHCDECIVNGKRQSVPIFHNCK